MIRRGWLAAVLLLVTVTASAQMELVSGGGGGLTLAQADSYYCKLVGCTMTGAILLPNGTAADPALTFTNSTGGFRRTGAHAFSMGTNDTDTVEILQGEIYMTSNTALAWTGTVNAAGGTADLKLLRDAANTLALRNGTNAQTFNLYNTYTDASNYERLQAKWVGNEAIVGIDVLGTGSTSRVLDLRAGGNLRLTSGGSIIAIVNSNGVLPSATNTYNSGDSTLAWKNHYVGTSIQGGGTKALTETSATGFVKIALAAGASVSGTIEYTIYATDTTDFQRRKGLIYYAFVNKAGALTSSISIAGTEATALSAGTLTNAFTAALASNEVTISSNATSSLVQTTLRIDYTVYVDGTATVTQL